MKKIFNAKETLEFYFRMASNGGWNWTQDNVSEVHGIIDDVVDGAVQEALSKFDERLSNLQKRVEELEKAEEERTSAEAMAFNVALYGGA